MLFDTGGDAKILLSNMKAMGSDPKYIWQIMISHDHWDHTGGLPKVLHADQKVYVLRSFSQGLKDQVKAAGAKIVTVKRFQEIIGGCTRPEKWVRRSRSSPWSLTRIKA